MRIHFLSLLQIKTMADRRSQRGPELEAETLSRIFTLLQLLCKDLRDSAKNPQITEKLRNCGGLGPEYWNAIKNLGYVTAQGSHRGTIAFWPGASPDTDKMPLAVLQEVRRIWANHKLEQKDKDKAGISGAQKLIPIVVRKQHNPGTIFINLQAIYDRHYLESNIAPNRPNGSYAPRPFSCLPYIQQYELTEEMFDGMVKLGFMSKIEDVENHYIWSQEPTKELAEIIFDEYFKDRHRTRSETYTDILKTLHKIWAVYKQGGQKPLDSSELRKIFEHFELGSKISAKIRIGVLDRAPSGKRGVVVYVWKTGLGVPDLEMAENCYHDRDTKTGKPIVHDTHTADTVPTQLLAHVVKDIGTAKDSQHDDKAWVKAKLDEVRELKHLKQLELQALDEREKALELVYNL